MPLSSDLAVNRLKLSNTAGKTTINTGAGGFCLFVLKLKASATMRNIIGSNPPWADPFSFSDYVNLYYDKNFSSTSPVILDTPELNQVYMQSIIAYVEIGDGVVDAMTGDPVSGIVYLSITTFAHDLGNVPLPTGAVSVQSLNYNTDVELANGNRGYGLIQSA
jgi:hypothetical protein